MNLSLGFMGFAVGIGATLSTTIAGWLADTYGEATAFFSLAFVGGLAVLLVWVGMSETRPEVPPGSENNDAGSPTPD